MACREARQREAEGNKIMIEFLNELLGILRVETGLYRQMLEAMGRERTALLRSRRTEIDALTVEKRDLIERLQAVERRRVDVLHHLSRHWDRPFSEVTLRRITRSSPEPIAMEFRRIRDELMGLMTRVKQENQRSEALCRHVGELLKTAYGVLKDWTASGFVYHRGGCLERARLNGKWVSDEI
jgi:flagellar biosynthesis/type III secretory pathway chaperone